MSMKRIILYAIIFSLIGLGFTACEKDYQVYDADLEAVCFNLEQLNNGADSLVYSFAFTPSVYVDTVDLPLQLLGFSATRDRIVNIIVDEKHSTAQQGGEYELLSARIPANSVNGLLQVKVSKTDRIAHEDVYVTLRITTSEDLVPGPVSQREIRLFISNQLTQPNGWPDQFGDYSRVKHQFCVEVLGKGADYTGDWALLTYYLNRLNQALYEYNSVHPTAPLRDENGVLISFSY